MTAGTYTIRVSKDLMFFESVTVKIAPNTPQLPDIITAGWVAALSHVKMEKKKSTKADFVPLDFNLSGSACAARSLSAVCPRA